MKKTLAFHSNQLSIRGTEVALFDYALHNQGLLNHRSLVVYDQTSPHNDPQTVEKFQRHFDLLPYQHRSEIDPLLQRSGVDLLYAIKAGRRDGLLSKTVPTMVHAVFPSAPSQWHGAAYAFISEWLSRRCSGDKVPSVPHIVDLPHGSGHLRLALGIEAEALVLGCHGGADSFDVPCAIEAVQQLLQAPRGVGPSVHFVFLNIKPFVQHPRAHFLPGSADMRYKTQFINTCDAMLHARRQGESFGLACGEFSIRNKPVLCFGASKHRHHLEVLGERAMVYHDTSSLLAWVKTLAEQRADHRLAQGNWDAYSARYKPERVMALFEQHLIRPALRNPRRDRPEFEATWRDRLRYLRFKAEMRLGH